MIYNHPIGSIIIPLTYHLYIVLANWMIVCYQAHLLSGNQETAELAAKFPVAKVFFFKWKLYAKWFKVTFWSPSWRSLNLLKGSLHHPKKVTLNRQVNAIALISFCYRFFNQETPLIIRNHRRNVSVNRSVVPPQQQWRSKRQAPLEVVQEPETWGFCLSGQRET